MESQVIPPSQPVDFTFDSTSPSLYATAPSSPQSTIPFTWEHKPGIPKHNFQHHDTDFAFVKLRRHSMSSADDLFDSGTIKPLKPPPRLHTPNDSPKKLILSPRKKYNDFEFDPFTEAFKQTTCEQTHTDENPSRRGRERTTKNSRCKSSRSLSPFRVSDIVNGGKKYADQSSPAGLMTWYSKWNIKNLLLFRSASEGSVTRRKDSLKMYTILSTDEEMKMKRKSGLMGCLRFHQNAGFS